jgi:dimethylaniline monooxygenase (N-oxide forming)
MVVRVALVACVAGILPSLVRAAVACALGAASFLAVAVAGGVAIASFAWQELAHPAPATRFEPATRSSDDAPGEKNSRAPGGEAAPVRSVCVIGGGAAGIVTARHMRARGFDVTLFERSDDVGGLWRYGSETCKVFANVTQNLTSNHNRFAGLKPPSAWPDYLGHEHTVQYLSAYVDAFALRPCIECNREVRSVARCDDGGFEVVVENLSPPGSRADGGKGKRRIDANANAKTKTEIRAFDAVAVCAGQLSAPNVPDDTAIPGLSGFTGTIMHTSEYRTSVPFADVAQDLCGVAAKTTLAARSHRWLVRRGLSGGRRSWLTRVTNWLPASLGLLLHLYAEMIPALRALARTKGATDGGDLLAAAALGRIRIKPALASARGDQVTFEDGSSDRFDAVIFATGFTRNLPFSFSLTKRKDETRDETRSSSKRAEEEKKKTLLSQVEKNASPLPRLYRGVLCADAPRVAFVLYVLPFGSHFQVAELQAAWAARVWRGELGTPSAEDMRRHSEPLARLAAHDATGDFYRAAYARLLAPSVFRTESFLATFAKLVRGSGDSGARHPKFVEPVLEWLPDPDARDSEPGEGPVPSHAVFRDAGADAAFARDGWSGWSIS